eukprot:scaffold12352_cov129-Isochrysis_galbana.AAC.7
MPSGSAALLPAQRGGQPAERHSPPCAACLLRATGAGSRCTEWYPCHPSRAPRRGCVPPRPKHAAPAEAGSVRSSRMRLFRWHLRRHS